MEAHRKRLNINQYFLNYENWFNIWRKINSKKGIVKVYELQKSRSETECTIEEQKSLKMNLQHTCTKSAWRASNGTTEESWDAKTSRSNISVWFSAELGPRSGGGSST